WKRSGGVPREINTLCFNALLLATAVAQERVDSAILHEILADLDFNPIPKDRPQPDIQEMQVINATPLRNADPPLASIDKIPQADVPSARKNACTKLVVSDGGELVHSGKMAPEMLPASRREKSQETTIGQAEAGADCVTATKVVAFPDRETEASENL